MSTSDSGATQFTGFSYPLNNQYTNGDTIYISDNTDYTYIGDPVEQTTNGVVWGNGTNGITLDNNWYATTFNIDYSKNCKYAVAELPRKDMPISVFICGRMLTLGILGTDVECAYTGEKLVFSPGVVGAISYGSRITMSVEYSNEIYHYNIGKEGRIEYINDSSTMVTALASTIKK